nr:GNAT family N-acetyltransferase [Rhizobium sp. Q54]
MPSLVSRANFSGFQPHAAGADEAWVQLHEVASPAARSDWADVFGSDPLALPTQGRDWTEAIISFGGYRDCSRLYRFHDGTEAILPLLTRKGVPERLQCIASPPAAWGFGGLVSSRPMTIAHHRTIAMDLERHPALQVSIRPNPFCSPDWCQAVGDGWIRLARRAHVLSLSNDFAAIRTTRFSSNARRHLRTAESASLEVVSGNDPDLLQDFHKLLIQSMDRWAAQQGEPSVLARLRGMKRDPLQKFSAIAKALGPQMQIFMARVGGQPAAAILVLYGRNAHYTRGAMDKALAAPTAANYLLHAMAIEEACRRGCESYHMGETGRSKSLADFKEKFGAVAVDYHELRHEKLPLTRVDAMCRGFVKAMLGVKDV